MVRMRYSTGVILALFFSYTFYTILYFVRETFRFFTHHYGDNLLVVLSTKENFYYNLFFGLIASILGYSIFIKFVVENSINHHNKKKKRHQRLILNNQAFSFWSFLSVFSRLGLV